MIKIKLTENFVGFNIVGTFDDFYELYDNISNFLGIEECSDYLEEDMRLHILGFLYDLRHAYQGDREIIAVDNGLTDEEKEYFGIKKSVKQNILYSFNYIVPELITDIVIFKYFAAKNKKKNEYDTNYNSVIAFYSRVIDSLGEILTLAQLNKVRRLLSNYLLGLKKSWTRQWYMILSIDYMKMTKMKRKKELMHTIDKICNFFEYDKYYQIKNEVEEYAKENNIIVTDVEYGNCPKEIEW